MRPLAEFSKKSQHLNLTSKYIPQCSLVPRTLHPAAVFRVAPLCVAVSATLPPMGAMLPPHACGSLL